MAGEETASSPAVQAAGSGTATSAPADSAVQAAARSIAPRAAELAAGTERERRVDPQLVEALTRAGIFRLCVPRALGGLEAPPAELVDVVRTLARGDASTAWVAMIGATSGALAAYLPESEARAVYGDPDVITGGVFAPRGHALRVGDSYRVTGRWPFVSGVVDCRWLMLGCLVQREGAAGPEQLDDGTADVRLMLVPASEAEVIDTWSVSGLRGTASHDVSLRDAVVPAARSASLMSDPPWPGGPLYGFPVFGLLALGIAAVALGTARAAIDDLLELAAGKTPTGSARTLAQRATVQAEVARAEAQLRAAGALVHESIDAAWQAAQARPGEPVATEHRLALRLAATHATRAAAGVVDAMYEAGGGTSIYDSSPLQRRFRDVHAATQHMMVSPATFELAGRLLLGLPASTAQL